MLRSIKNSRSRDNVETYNFEGNMPLKSKSSQVQATYKGALKYINM